MSTEKTTVLVVAVRPNHPAGRRNRAGITFTTEAVAYDVTNEQKAAILADEYLRVIDKGTALADAMAKYDAKKNRSSAPVDPQGPDSTSDAQIPSDAEKIEPAPTEADVPPATPEAEVPETPISRMNKEQLVAALEAKGLVSGTDFQPDAKNKDLAALLSSL